MVKPLRYGSVCSGIEAATAAWHPLGWEPAFFSEIEAFPRAVLKHHFPRVPCHGEFTTIKGDEYGPIDCLSEERPAKTTVSLACEKDWTASVADSPLSFPALLIGHLSKASYGKTSLAYSRTTEAETSELSSQPSAVATGLFSSHQKEDGETVALLNLTMLKATASHGACLTLNTCEWMGTAELFLNDDGVCSLSDILETGDVPQRYYLTAKACRGILRRAEKRGKELPETLRRALSAVAGA